MALDSWLTHGAAGATDWPADFLFRISAITVLDGYGQYVYRMACYDEYRSSYVPDSVQI